MSLLDDENILIDDIRNESFKKIHCDMLGRVYMTKHGDFGYVWDIKADGTPKTLMRVSSEPVNLRYLFDLEKSINKFEKNEGWYIPTKEQFLKSLSWADLSKHQPTIIDDIVKHMLSNIGTQFCEINYKYLMKNQQCPLTIVGGRYWLKDGESYDLNTVINIYPSISLQFNQSELHKILFLKDLEEDEIQSYEDSDKMINKMMNNLSVRSSEEILI